MFFLQLERNRTKLKAMAEALTPGQKRSLIKKLQLEIMKKLEEDIKKHQEAEYIEFEGHKIRKTLTQRIPATKEELEKYQRDKKAYGNKKQISYIDKVFFEDGALQMPPPKPKEKLNLKEIKQQQDKSRELDSFIDKVFFEDGALQLEKRGIRK